MSAKFFAIKNLSSSTTTVLNPWEVKRVIPEEARTSKIAFVDWTKKPDTEGCHYSLFEGLDPNIRVSGSNPPVAMHGVVADYDTVLIDDTELTKLASRAKSEHFPCWASRTFSGGARLVWLFEKPLPLPNTKEAIQAILKKISKQLGFNKLLPGWDSQAFDQDFMYYELGTDWIRLSADTIPSNLVHLWAFEACKGIKMATRIEDIPLVEVAKELERRFPGRWNGPFEEGMRGCRFWDNAADNPTAAVVRKGGMQCFTGATGFIGWREIFGSSFVEKYRVSTIGNIINGTYYDGDTYFVPKGVDDWVAVNKEDYKLNLKVKYGLSGKSDGKGNPSEIEQVLFQIQDLNRVDACMPFVHFPHGLMTYQGRRFLNTSRVRPMQPAPEACKTWGDGFPWLAEFFDSFFEPAGSGQYFLAWLKWFYVNALNQTPRKGHAIFIAGGPGIGKSFLSTCILSKMMGGHHEAGDFLTGEGGRFTEHLFSKPILTLDDSLPSNSPHGHTRYTAAVKKLVANHDFQFEAKFGKAAQVPWLGRLVVTMNLDPEALRMLPDIEDSIADKLCFFRAAMVGRKFPHDAAAIVDHELPHFCRWLVDWTIPAAIVGEARFGIRQYLEEKLYQQAAATGSGSMLEEVLNIFAERYRKQMDVIVRGDVEDRRLVWVGTSAKLLTVLAATQDLEPLVRPYTSNNRLLGRELSKLASRPGSRVMMSGGRAQGGRGWIIDCRALRQQAVTVEVEVPSCEGHAPAE